MYHTVRHAGEDEYEYDGMVMAITLGMATTNQPKLFSLEYITWKS